jgi:hypothetical protein
MAAPKRPRSRFSSSQACTTQATFLASGRTSRHCHRFCAQISGQLDSSRFLASDRRHSATNYTTRPMARSDTTRTTSPTAASMEPTPTKRLSTITTSAWSMSATPRRTASSFKTGSRGSRGKVRTTTFRPSFRVICSGIRSAGGCSMFPIRMSCRGSVSTGRYRVRLPTGRP